MPLRPSRSAQSEHKAARRGRGRRRLPLNHLKSPMQSSPSRQAPPTQMASAPQHFLLLLFLALLCAASQMAQTAAAESNDTLIGLLERVQSVALSALGPRDFDAKLYVDLPLIADQSAAEAALAELRNPSPEQLKAFLAKYFGKAGSDLVAADPPDWEAEPRGFLPGVESREARAWALEVHALWKTLSRQVAAAVAAQPEGHTLLPLPGRVVVPGGIFREVYYWDSYWIVRGLMVSKMYDTAKEIVLNLVYLVEKYGLVPNGARSYYTNRSQPPLLSSMILDIYTSTGDLGFVRRVFPSLLKEHSFWMSEVHNVAVMDNHGRVHNLCRYQAMWSMPRPESATTDAEWASKLTSTSAKETFYHQIASTAESGWDFSSRWMSNSTDLTTLATTFIIPVDLNTFILKMEQDIAVFANLIGEISTAAVFSKASKARHIAIESVLWNSEMDQWLDYWLPTDGNSHEVHQWKSESQNRQIFASNFIPLWLNAHNSGLGRFVNKSKSVRVMRSLKTSGLLHPAGIATSLTKSGQQWDSPNGWAPLQYLLAEGLLNSGSAEAKEFARDIATRWLRTNYGAYKSTGVMHEKYDVEVCGAFGGGGGYKPQTGFGWSNGVVLSFLDEYGWPKDKEIGCLS